MVSLLFVVTVNYLIREMLFLILVVIIFQLFKGNNFIQEYTFVNKYMIFDNGTMELKKFDHSLMAFIGILT